MIELYDIKEVLKKDFNNLYQERFTMDWRDQRLVRGLEIDVMSLDNLEKLFNKANTLSGLNK
jgi:hypothetical protein